jgi:ATP-binding cassette subfamily B protein
MKQLRSDVEDKLHRLPLVYVDGTPRGDLLSRVTNDIDNLAQSLQMSTTQALNQVLLLIGVVVMMISISPLLALFSTVLIPLSMVLVRFVAKNSRRRFAEQWRHTGELNSLVEETFTGHSLVKVFGQQRAVEHDFSTTNDELYRAGSRAQFVAGVMQPIMMFVGNLNYIVVAVLGSVRVTTGAMSVGDIQAFIQYARQYTQPLTALAGILNMIQSSLASSERVFELLDAPEESAEPGVVDSTDADAGDGGGRVEFSHVSFRYAADRPLIEDLSFVAEPGETVAIVGPTGAGKTTLVNLIMRFYELDAGLISLDGVDIATLDRAQLRSRIGMVLQDTWLFEGTILDNIRYGNLDASESQILDAAKAAYVDRFVHALPDGYDTVIDEDGGNLSAGEKQLLTIARAFLNDPSILILDEATSSVDTRTEVLVQHAMAALRSRRTSFVIAHRLSTIRDADHILMMENGSIVEQGGHDELLARRGAFFALYDAQFRSPLADEADEETVRT